MSKKQKKMLCRIIVSFILLILTAVGFNFVSMDPAAKTVLTFILYFIPYIIAGYDILWKAWRGILSGQVFDENFLMAIATLGALILGDYAEAAAVMLFYQTGELFQSYAVGKSRKNITDLMDICPEYANVEIDGTLCEVDPDEVEIGTVITVKPGEKIPIDGIITEGSSTINTSALTGESVPKRVGVGDLVISGCVNLNGLLKIRTNKEFEDSTVAKILDLVENSGLKKAKTEKFITKFAHYYTPAVCFGALALAVLPPVLAMLFGYDAEFGMWIYRALTFLVISCPCALVISIPLSFFAGIGCAGHEGILIKGSDYLEMLSKAKIVVFDKTGTMTEGVFEVTKILPARGAGEEQNESAGYEVYSKEKILEYAALSESYSDHPISKSLQRAYGKPLERKRVTETKEIAGHGIMAKIDGNLVAAGNEKLMEKLGISYEKAEDVGTVVYLAVDERYVGSVLISDKIKPDAQAAIDSLKQCGVSKTVMLTGDNQNVAQDVASKLGIMEVHSELLPADKVELVEKLLSEKPEKEALAFVGDGINDAPVLSRADVGIAMGAMGSDAAIEAADVVLMDDQPKKISLAIRIARKCMRIVYENISFAIGVKFICLILGAFGLANMWLAIFADVGVMVIAVLNAIRAIFIRK